jgi:hypothetical protein
MQQLFEDCNGVACGAARCMHQGCFTILGQLHEDLLLVPTVAALAPGRLQQLLRADL